MSRAYTEPERRLYAEGMRTVPGILAARNRSDSEAVTLLTDAYFSLAAREAIGRDRAWAILFTATTYWACETAGALAISEKRPLEVVLQCMGAEAAEWVSNTRGVSGY